MRLDDDFQYLNYGGRLYEQPTYKTDKYPQSDIFWMCAKENPNDGREGVWMTRPYGARRTWVIAEIHKTGDNEWRTYYGNPIAKGHESHPTHVTTVWHHDDEGKLVPKNVSDPQVAASLDEAANYATEMLGLLLAVDNDYRFLEWSEAALWKAACCDYDFTITRYLPVPLKTKLITTTSDLIRDAYSNDEDCLLLLGQFWQHELKSEWV